MPAISNSAPAKIILFGEHAVVYGRPAIAIPFWAVKASCNIFARPDLEEPQIEFVSLDQAHLSPELQHNLADLMNYVVAIVLEYAHTRNFPASQIRVGSTIPLGSGLGSSAAIAVAMIRACTEFLGLVLDQSEVNKLAYLSEIHTHGHPSGLDNTVITQGKPVYYVKDQIIQPIMLKGSRTFVVADTGIPGSTSDQVSRVNRMWKSTKSVVEEIFDSIGSIAEKAKAILSNDSDASIGELMTKNHELLQKLGVSSPQLDQLVNSAINAGANGAKMTGGGGGGNIITEVPPQLAKEIESKLIAAGAVRTWITKLNSKGTSDD